MQNCNMAFGISRITYINRNIQKLGSWTRFVFLFKCAHTSQVNQPCSTFALWSALARGGLVTDAAFGGKTVLLQPLVLHGIFCTAEKHSPIRACPHWIRRCCCCCEKCQFGCLFKRGFNREFQPRRWARWARGRGACQLRKQPRNTQAYGETLKLKFNFLRRHATLTVTLWWPIT